jgi:pimeloyl-ACP methyl ester carboxylesterase
MKKIFFLSLSMLFLHELAAQNGNFANVNGVKLYYETHGKGEPLVLLHNFFTSHKKWEPWIDSLAEDFKLIIPDLRGHGNSTNPSSVFRHEDSAKDIYALMDELDIINFKAIGASSGGMTLVHMATMDSTRIVSMVLVGATSYLGESDREFKKTLTFETIPESWLTNMRIHQPGGDSQIKMLLEQFKATAYVYDDMNFTSPYLSLIKCPTLIVHGDKDGFFPIEIPFEMHKSIPNSFLWIIPNGEHLPVWNILWSDKFLEVSKLFLTDKLN